ncbi:hypothetical protein [Streptomyces sp. NBC_01716]|uniref:hypothetical protein n=1 Tax=Streptomyces sp. NBC_01716 TaxID=2975917 RepID=UPI002E362D50|nr:hypothetical protein [Streptomyces sp. NBC_01716]
MELAPLLIQQMELAPDEEGRDVLRPSGVPSLHTGAVSELLDAGDAADLVSHWQPAWQEDNDAQTLCAVRELLEELGLPELEPLDPSALSERTVTQALRPGAHNAAVLLAPSGVEAIATQALVDNLLQMSTRTEQIPGTTLDAERRCGQGSGRVRRRGGSGAVQREPGAGDFLGDQPLTVVTGPHGTGKSEVVTAVATTCVGRR